MWKPVVVVLLSLAVAHGQGDDSSWRRIEPLPAPTGELIAVNAPDGPVLAGGLRGQWQVVDEVWQYSSESDEWIELPPLPVPLNHHAAAVTDGVIYVMGGSSEFAGGVAPRSDVFALHPAAGEWREVESMPGPRLGHAAVALDGRIYVVGGVADEDARLFIFDTREGTWQVGPAMSEARDHLAIAALHGRLYAIGGRHEGRNRRDVEVFDPVTGTWTDGPPLDFARSGFATAVVNGRIHVAGGEDLATGTVLDSHEVFDAQSGTWTAAEALPQPVHGAAGLALGDDFLVVGGSGRAGGRSAAAWLAQAWRFVGRATR